MKKTFLLEGERITLHHAKELFGERYLTVLAEAKRIYLRDPLRELNYMTREGILTIWFQPD